jgi:hypothetical protein
MNGSTMAALCKSSAANSAKSFQNCQQSDRQPVHDPDLSRPKAIEKQPTLAA